MNKETNRQTIAQKPKNFIRTGIIDLGDNSNTKKKAYHSNRSLGSPNGINQS